MSQINYEAIQEKYIQMFNDSHITAQKELITPEIARALLDNQAENRPIRPIMTKKLEADILNGNWKLNGETIVIYENGKLKDGQHRLTAIVHSGMSIPSLVVRGVKEDAVEHDLGAKRTTVDLAHLYGLDPSLKSRQVHSAIRTLFNYRLWVHGSRVESQILTESEIMRFATENSELIEQAIYASRATRSNNPTTGKGGVIAAVMCAIKSEIPKGSLYDFFEVVATGMTNSAGMSPALVLNRTITKTDFKTAYNGTGSGPAIMDITMQAIADFCDELPRSKMYKAMHKEHPYFKPMADILSKYQTVVPIK